MKKKRHLHLFAIVMINIIAVDSIRTLPIAAQFGFSLVFYYLIAGIFFLIPSALVSAELGTAWPETGGIYIWIKEAFGVKVASIMIWLNWVYNLAWFPTIMTLAAGVIGYLINPDLLENRFYMITMILTLFWLATFFNCFGMKLSSLVSTAGALFGTLLPMIFISILAIVYSYSNKPMQIDFSWATFFPSGHKMDELGYFSTVLYSLLGLEMVATHAREMVHPQRDYPKALGISVVIILTSIILASLSIAIVVPIKTLSFSTGIIQAFSVFLTAFSMPYLTPIMGLAIILGALSCASAWIIGPTKGIMVAASDHIIPSFLTKKNKENVPMNALLSQGVIVTLLSFIFLFMPSVNSAFLILSIITSQLAMIVYITLFAASIRLHYKKRHVKRVFKIPGGNAGIWITAVSGMTISTLALIAGFVKPNEIHIESYFTYLLVILSIMISLCILPLIFSKFASK